MRAEERNIRDGNADFLLELAPQSVLGSLPFINEPARDGMSAVTSKCTTHGHFKVHHPLGLN